MTLLFRGLIGSILLSMLVLLILYIILAAIYTRSKSKKIMKSKQELGTLITMNATYGLQSAFNRTLSSVCSSKKRKSRIIVVDRLRKESEYRDASFDFEGVDIELASVSIMQGKGIKKLTSQFAFSIALFKEIKKHIYDIDTIYAFDFDTGIVVYLFTFFFPHITFYYHIADFYADSRLSSAPKFIRLFVASLERMIMRRSNHAFICVEYRTNQIGTYNKKNLEVIHNSPVLENESMIRKDPVYATELPIKVGYVGTLRGNRFLIETIEAIKKNPNVELHIAGVGVIADEIEKMSNESSGIFYYGQMKYEETFEFYKKCDIILSVYDPQIQNHKYSAPNKFYEAMLLGKAIIVAKDTGVDSLVSKHEIGYVIDYAQQEFEKLLSYLVTQEGMNELQVLKERSYNCYDLYSWSVQKNKIVSLLDGDADEKI